MQQPSTVHRSFGILCGTITALATLMAGSIAVIIIGVATGSIAPHGASDDWLGLVVVGAVAVVVLAIRLGAWACRAVLAGVSGVPFLAVGVVVSSAAGLLWSNWF